MRKLIVTAAALAAFTSPVMAAEGEGRVEARAGIVWAGGAEDFVGGAAAGYDFDLGDSAFVGPEVSVDSDFEGTTLVNLGGRLGFKAGDATKLYAIAAYDVGDGEEFNAGVGAQLDLSEKLYGKAEYRRYFYSGTDANVAGVALGLKF